MQRLASLLSFQELLVDPQTHDLHLHFVLYSTTLLDYVADIQTPQSEVVTATITESNFNNLGFFHLLTE